MAGDSKREFNTAVRECLANCYRTDLPVAALAEYVELLKGRDWTPAEIHRVEATVMKILLAVVSKNERDDLVNRIIKPAARRSASTGDSSDSTTARNPGTGSVLPAPAVFGIGGDSAKRS